MKRLSAVSPAITIATRLLRIALLLGAVSAAGQTVPTLVGDAILGFRVQGTETSPIPGNNWELRLTVDYSYNVAHPNATVGAYLLPQSAEFQAGNSFWATDAIQERREGNIIYGTQKVAVHVRLEAAQVSTSQIRLNLYERAGEFQSRIFDYRISWEQSKVTLFDALPDLVILDGIQNPAGRYVKHGTTLHFVFRVMNRGDAPTSGYISVNGPGGYRDCWRKDGSVCSPDPLKPGEIAVVAVDYPVYSLAAVYTLTFAVDGENLIRESDESNNRSQEVVVQTF